MTNIVIFLALLTLGYLIGRYNENSHYEDIKKREAAYVHLPTSSSKKPIDDTADYRATKLANGGVVVSIDYFKRVSAGLRGLLGGRVGAYETLVDRGRREAILRMKESCPSAKEIINVRIETSTIHQGNGGVGSIEVFAYGTALYEDASAEQATSLS